MQKAKKKKKTQIKNKTNKIGERNGIVFLIQTFCPFLWVPAMPELIGNQQFICPMLLLKRG